MCSRGLVRRGFSEDSVEKDLGGVRVGGWAGLRDSYRGGRRFLDFVVRSFGFYR